MIVLLTLVQSSLTRKEVVVAYTGTWTVQDLSRDPSTAYIFHSLIMGIFSSLLQTVFQSLLKREAVRINLFLHLEIQIDLSLAVRLFANLFID